MWFLIPVLVVLALIVAAFVAGLMILAGLGALIAAVLHQWPWLLILFGVWMLVRPRHGHHRHRPVWSGGPQSFAASPRPAASVAERERPAPPAAPAPAPEPPKKRELPIDLRVKVEQIRHKADVLLGYAERFPPFSQDLHIVRQTAADYLPRTIEAYLALPGLDDPVIAASGKTALTELREQLELLDSKLDDIAQDLQREDVDRLLANRRFLEERFRPRETASEATPPPASATPPASDDPYAGPVPPGA